MIQQPSCCKTLHTVTHSTCVYPDSGAVIWTHMSFYSLHICSAHLTELFPQHHFHNKHKGKPFQIPSWNNDQNSFNMSIHCALCVREWCHHVMCCCASAAPSYLFLRQLYQAAIFSVHFLQTLVNRIPQWFKYTLTQSRFHYALCRNTHAESTEFSVCISCYRTIQTHQQVDITSPA